MGHPISTFLPPFFAPAVYEIIDSMSHKDRNFGKLKCQFIWGLKGFEIA
jgi:hypothetical protein